MSHTLQSSAWLLCFTLKKRVDLHLFCFSNEHGDGIKINLLVQVKSLLKNHLHKKKHEKRRFQMFQLCMFLFPRQPHVEQISAFITSVKGSVKTG